MLDQQTRGEETHLAGAHLVKGDKGKRLRQHGRRQILLGHDKRDQDARKQQLRQKRNALDPEPRSSRKRRRQVQERVVRAKVMSMVDAPDMMQIRMHQKLITIPVLPSFISPYSPPLSTNVLC